MGWQKCVHRQQAKLDERLQQLSCSHGPGRFGQCRVCRVTQDRNVNSAKNLVLAWRSTTSMIGNEPSPCGAPSNQASRLREQDQRAEGGRHEGRCFIPSDSLG
jgi:hypothetical protein